MNLSAKEIAGIINGKIDGNSDIVIHNVSKIEDAAAGTLSFLANPKYEDYIYTTKASLVIVNEDFKPKNPVTATLIRVEKAYESFAKLLETFKKASEKTGIEQPSFIDATATIGENVYIGAFAYIGKGAIIGNHVKVYPNSYVGDYVQIEDGTTIHAGVKIYSYCSIGKNCSIHSGCVIGADGFGFTPDKDNTYLKVPQIGNVIIEDNVEIGANTTVDRATLGSTIIRQGAKLDNLIQIAHNAEVGEHTVIAAQTGVAGSSKIGKYCMLGGQVGITGHVQIADKTIIAAQSGVGSNVKEKGTTLQGSPAFDILSYRKSYVLFKNLTKLESRIRELEAEIKELTSQKA
jgi:UDP-3-O-[3-hydroxymyristoyl] glucosamine N-acyltransferase